MSSGIPNCFLSKDFRTIFQQYKMTLLVMIGVLSKTGRLKFFHLQTMIYEIQE